MSNDCQQYVYFWGGPWHHEYHWWNVCGGPQVVVPWPSKPPYCPDVTQIDDKAKMYTARYDLRQRYRSAGAGNCTWIAECVGGCDEPK